MATFTYWSCSLMSSAPPWFTHIVTENKLKLITNTIAFLLQRSHSFTSLVTAGDCWCSCTYVRAGCVHALQEGDHRGWNEKNCFPIPVIPFPLQRNKSWLGLLHQDNQQRCHSHVFAAWHTIVDLTHTQTHTPLGSINCRWNKHHYKPNFLLQKQDYQMLTICRLLRRCY